MTTRKTVLTKRLPDKTSKPVRLKKMSHKSVLTKRLPDKTSKAVLTKCLPDKTSADRGQRDSTGWDSRVSLLVPLVIDPHRAPSVQTKRNVFLRTPDEFKQRGTCEFASLWEKKQNIPDLLKSTDL